MNTPLHSAANKALHSNAFTKALAEELRRVPVPGLTDPVPAAPAQEDLLALIRAKDEPLTVTIGEVFAFVTVARR